MFLQFNYAIWKGMTKDDPRIILHSWIQSSLVYKYIYHNYAQ